VHDRFLFSAAEEVLDHEIRRGLSLKTFLVLAVGVGLWTIYGILLSDAIIVLANGASLCALLEILYFKLREDWDAA